MFTLWQNADFITLQKGMLIESYGILLLLLKSDWFMEVETMFITVDSTHTLISIS